ncbi:YolD-like family protein [Halobacillus sp. A1]|uniref:YolD-like family protein n=1 Tax=Halobacillus sp. A1 TaxID=2880262 RepID=UPI0020A6AA34|nr:YolD-like family protein [Halobacillus sp. A1]MCP3032305.1 YolD-like family protein [Halobacillus sp. A1]
MRNTNDRGTIKWTSLMLPEHVEMVQEIWRETERIEKPVIDEQQMEENSFALQRSMNDDLTVNVKYHNGFDFSYAAIKVNQMDPSTKKVRGIDPKTKETVSLLFDDISEITFP